MLRKVDGTTLGGTLAEVQTTGKHIKKQQTLRRAGAPIS